MDGHYDVDDTPNEPHSETTVNELIVKDIHITNIRDWLPQNQYRKQKLKLKKQKK